MDLKSVRRSLLASAIAGIAVCGVASAVPAARAATPDDPGFPLEFGLENTGQTVAGQPGLKDADIDAPEAWRITQGSRRVIVAVVDSGVAYDQPDLKSRMWTNPGESGKDAQGRNKRSNGVDDDHNGYVDDVRGWDFVGDDRSNPNDQDNDPMDTRGHGTHVAGTIGAIPDNAFGTTGVAPEVKIMPVRVQGPRATFAMSDLALGLQYAAANGARIVNVSLADHERSPAVEAVIRKHPDVLFVVASNNEGLNLDDPANKAYPCQLPEANIVCVGATDNKDVLASFSNYGAGDVDLTAPGTPVLSVQPARRIVQREGFGTGALLDDPPRWTTGANAGTSTWGSTLEAGGLTDSPTTPYAGGSDTWVQTAIPFDLRRQRGCTLRTRLTYDTVPDQDGLYLQARTDLAFAPPRADFDDANPYGFGDTEAFLTGKYAGDKAIDVSDFDGKLLWLRFGLLARSPNPTALDGVSLDELTVSCLGGGYSSDGLNQTEVEAGTSMATPHVSGVAALIAARYPDATTAQIKADLMEGVDVLPPLLHRIRTTGRLNAYKSLAESSVAVRGGVLRVEAGRGERNRFSIRKVKGAHGRARYRVSDPYAPIGQAAFGSRLDPGRGCTRVALTTVECSAGSVSSVHVSAGDLDDRVAVAPGVATATVAGGAGSDTLLVRRGDHVAGGPGANKVVRR